MATADVFVAFVRDDQAFAEAIAIALQDSGMAVSRSSSVMEAIDASPAVVVLWTQASSRSRLFLDAADRAFRSGKMILARLGPTPPPAEFSSAAQHQFHTWSGDPDHNELAIIVGQVQRLVAFARGRASAAGGMPIGAAKVHQFPNTAPRMAPPQQGGPQQGMMGGPPPSYQPQPRQPAPPQPPADPLMEEAAFWRQVQAGGTPNDFRAYLDRYGPTGTFSEIAAMRLKQASPPPTQRPAEPPRYAPPPQSPPPQARQPAPPPYRPGPSAGEAGRMEGDRFQPDRSPAQRRPADGRRPDDRPPPFLQSERGKSEPAPAKSGGGGVGLLLLLVIVGGLAAAGWWVYNGGSMTPLAKRDDPGAVSAPIREEAEIEAPPAAEDAGPMPRRSLDSVAPEAPGAVNRGVGGPSAKSSASQPAAARRSPPPPPQRSSTPVRAAAPKRAAADDPTKAAFQPPPQPSPEELARREQEQRERERLAREIRDATAGPPQ